MRISDVDYSVFSNHQTIHIGCILKSPEIRKSSLEHLYEAINESSLHTLPSPHPSQSIFSCQLQQSELREDAGDTKHLSLEAFVSPFPM